MIFAIIPGPSIEEALEQVDQANRIADGIELRLDAFSSFDLDHIVLLKARSKLPILFTLRSVAQGGFFQAEKEIRLNCLSRLLKLAPDFMDISDKEDLQYLRKNKPRKTKWIYSYHNYQSTHSNLDRIFLSMQDPDIEIYKICTFASSTIDALRLLLWTKQKNAEGKKLIGLCMGEKGQITRILSPIIKNYMQFAPLHSKDAIAPGQLTVAELKEIYHIEKHDEQTAIYGLIGNPVAQSPSHQTHNLFFKKQNLNAVYVKMILAPEELGMFLTLAAEFGFKGLSVTIPFKEEVMKHLKKIDSYAQDIGAVNTLVLSNEMSWKGYNTDAPAALDAIEEYRSVNGKKIVILGAGGAARAIAFEAKSRGADIEVFTRNLTKRSWNPQWNIPFFDIESLSKAISYDVLINATPDPSPIPLSCIVPQSIIMDINTSHRDTDFLNRARELNCTVIEGLEMFERQAARQMNLWFNLEIQKVPYKEINCIVVQGKSY